MFPLAFVAGWLQGHWWGFISRNYVVCPTFLLMNVFIALKGSHFWFLFTTTRWRRSMESAASYCTPIRTRCSWKSRPMVCTWTWPSMRTSTTLRITRKTTHCTALGARRYLEKMKDECAGRPIAEYVGLRPKMCSILEASGKSIKAATAWKRTPRRSTSTTSRIKKPSLKSRPFNMEWTFCGKSVITSMGSVWTRYRSRPSTPGTGSQKMGRTHWPMGTKMQSLQVELFNAMT